MHHKASNSATVFGRTVVCFFPLLVERHGDRYKARDGNDRWYVYHTLHGEDSEKWAFVNCLIFPDEMPESDKREALRIVHNVGSTEWPPESRIAFALMAREDGKTDEEICQSAGFVQLKDFKLHEQTYMTCQDYQSVTKDKDSHWSKWFEVVKRSPKKVEECLKIPSIKKIAFKAMKDGKLINPQKARGLVAVMQNEKALKALNDNKDIGSALQIAVEMCRAGKDSTDTCFARMDETLRSLADKRDKVAARLKLHQTDDWGSFRGLLREMSKIIRKANATQMIWQTFNVEQVLKKKQEYEARKANKK